LKKRLSDGKLASVNSANFLSKADFMGGHHLILGKLNDSITGEILDDTHDERYRQKLADLLVNEKKYLKSEIHPRFEIRVSAGKNSAIVKIDFVITLDQQVCMIVKYAPGSLVTRHRPALAASRLVASYQIPLVVVTNGEDADILDGPTGEVLARGLKSVPAKPELVKKINKRPFNPISARQNEMEARVLYAYEVDDRCPGDDTICKV
jgi:hypothetical protein